ncbi:MAG TPA: hypothetical protein VKR21_06035, partial [Solirubrobacteraceae bacterium]|nr:hypothetical protein [Solirubrobacteraceae bacterium]
VQVQTSHEAPLGPTCVFESTAGTIVATLAMEHGTFDRLRPLVRDVAAVTDRGRTTYCGTLGQHMLWAPVAADEMLVITAPCDSARTLASLVLPRIA